MKPAPIFEVLIDLNSKTLLALSIIKIIGYATLINEKSDICRETHGGSGCKVTLAESRVILL